MLASFVSCEVCALSTIDLGRVKTPTPAARVEIFWINCAS